MKCDQTGCARPAVFAPEIFTPAEGRPQLHIATEYRPVRLMLRLTFCEQHVDVVKPHMVLNDQMKARIEEHAKKTRPADFKPDFDRAWIWYVRINSDEYRKFVAMVDANKELARQTPG